MACGSGGGGLVGGLACVLQVVRTVRVGRKVQRASSSEATQVIGA